MKQNIQVFQRSNSLWARFLESNPQLFRELKGRFKTRNIIIAAAVSIMTQFLVVISLMGELPRVDPNGILKNQYGRYALGNGTQGSTIYTKDLLGNWVINWQLLWLDLFLALSVIIICSLLVFGTYLLIADVVKEEDRGTFNFIRLSPQSAGSILLGKILGVPILLYTAILLMFPLHLLAGLSARIPLTLIVGFDATVVASCAFFYSLALFLSLMDNKMASFKPWLASGTLGFLLVVTTKAIFSNYMDLDHPFGWFFLFNPHLVLAYLVESTHLPSNKIDFIPVHKLEDFVFYGQALWAKASWGIGFIFLNLSIWTYWCWSILKRRFHNPETTLISKTQSYWLTGWLVVFAVGLSLQNIDNNHTRYGFPSDLGACFLVLQFYLGVWGAILIGALSPHRQTLHDWSRYRHQVSKNGNILWKELVFADNSPSVVALAINLFMAIAYITPSIFIHLDSQEQHLIFWSFILTGGGILLCGLVAQFMLTLKNRKRAIWSAVTVISMIIIPPLSLGFAGFDPRHIPEVWFFTLMPAVAIEHASQSMILMALFGQCLAISVAGFGLTRKLKQAGKSETKALLG